MHASDPHLPPTGPAPRGGTPPAQPQRQREGFFDDFLRFFRRGLAALLPTLITLLLLFKLWEILWDYLGRHIIAAIVWVHQQTQEYPHPVGPVRWFWYENMSQWQRELLGVFLAIICVYMVGLVVGNFIGRTAWRLAELIVMRIPLIRAIYPAVKQVTDFLLSERKNQIQASRVVAVQPHADGIWSLGLVTGPGVKPLADVLGADMVTVFIPSSPTAFSGYVLVVPRDRLIELPISVEEAMRLLLTGGVSNPNDPALDSLRGKRAIPTTPVATPAPTAQLNPRPE